MRGTKLNGTGSRGQFHSQNHAQVVNNLAEFATSVPAHRDMIFLHRRRRDAVYRGWVCQALVLGNQTGLGVLSDHQTAVDTGIVRQERRQTRGTVLIKHAVGAAL